MENKNIKYKRNKNVIISLCIFGLIFFLMFLAYVYQTKIMPEQLMREGLKNYEVGNYTTALTMFKNLSDIRPYDEAPIYHQALVLAKMPSTFNTQRALYEIALLEDCEEASEYARKVLESVREGFAYSVGPSFIDNVLYKQSMLVRWDLSEPISYMISSEVSSIPNFYKKTVKNAFQNWQNATHSEISFKEVFDERSAKIIVKFVPASSIETKNGRKSANVSPTIDDSKLIKMDVSICATDLNGNQYTEDKLLTLAQHQLGHALGLWGHSANSKDIMFHTGDLVSDDLETKKLSVRDINTLALVYRMIPDITDKVINESQYDKYFYHQILTTHPAENYNFEVQRLLDETMQNKNNVVVWVDVAINYAKAQQYLRSNVILEKILPIVANELRNKHVVLYNLAANYYKLRDYQVAKAYLNSAKAIHQDVDTKILEAFLDLKLGKTLLAKKKLAILNQHYPDNIEIALKLAETYAFCNEPDNEKIVINNLIKRNPIAIKDRRVAKYR